ncbi:unnamed protein product, partial [Prorocentrum cordatum]
EAVLAFRAKVGEIQMAGIGSSQKIEAAEKEPTKQQAAIRQQNVDEAKKYREQAEELQKHMLQQMGQLPASAGSSRGSAELMLTGMRRL